MSLAAISKLKNMDKGQNSMVRRGFLKSAGTFAALNPLKLLLPTASLFLLSRQRRRKRRTRKNSATGCFRTIWSGVRLK